MRVRSGKPRKDIELSVKGYKAIRNEVTLRIAPLTVIAGANSSGKSSFMQPFLLMKQTLDSAFDPGPILLHGPNVKVTDHAQILSRGKSKQDVVDKFSVGFKSSNSARVVTFSVESGQLAIESDKSSDGEDEVSVSDPLPATEIDKLKLRFAELAQRYRGILQNGATEKELAEWGFEVGRNRCFLELSLDLGIDGTRYGISVRDSLLDETPWVEMLRDLIHVPGLRGNPERSYNRSAVGSSFPGTFDTYVASIVYGWTQNDKTKLTKLSSQLENLGLTWKLHAKRLNDASIELLVGRTQHAQQGGANDLVSVADVGFGVSQTLPVLVALLVAKRGQLVYIEQPEIHLHPRAQHELSDALVDAARRGVLVVVETHSSLVVRGIQTAVAERRLAPESLSLNWFGRDAQRGFLDVISASVDRAGRFGDWPVDFDEISQEADWSYLDAVEESGV